MNKEKKTKASIDNIYTLNGKVPLGHAVPFGLQHILAMFVANIAPIIIVANACKLSNGQIAMLIQSAMLIAGIGTLIQLFPIWRVGSGLPIVMGISFTFVSILCFIGTTYGYETIVGAVLVGGILEGTLGLFAKYWLKWISPIVAASVVTAIGFSLLSVGSASFGGGSGSENFGSVQNWIIGTVTLLSCILFNLFAKSYFKQLSVLFGLVVGYILAVCMHQVDFSALANTSIIAFPHIMPFKMEFNLNRIQYVILSILRKNKADSPMLSMSCNEIAEIEKYDKPSTIYKHLRILESLGYVERGAKVERATGYIITAAGLKVLPDNISEDTQED